MGIGDGKLSEKLQLDKDLTLEKAILTVRQAEQVRQQQVVLSVDLRRLLATSIPCECNIANIRIPRIPEVGEHASNKKFKPNNVKNASGVAGHPSMIESIA